MILCNKKHIFSILFSLSLFPSDSNQKQLKSFTEIKKLGVHIYQKNPESVIADAYRNYCHRQNIDNIHKIWEFLRKFNPDSFNETLPVFKSKFHRFRIFDDRIDSNAYSSERYISKKIQDAIIKKKLIRMHKQSSNFPYPNHPNSVYDITIDNEGDVFFRDFSQRYCLKHEVEDTVRVKLKKRDKNGNALKNSDSAYIFVEELQVLNK